MGPLSVFSEPKSYHIFIQLFSSLYIPTPFRISHMHWHYGVIVVSIHYIFTISCVIDLGKIQIHYNSINSVTLGYFQLFEICIKFLVITLKYSCKNWRIIFSASGWQFSIFMCTVGKRDTDVVSSSSPSNPIIFGNSLPSFNVKRIILVESFKNFPLENLYEYSFII